MDNLEAVLKAEKQKVKEMRVEVKTVKEFAKTELQSMTQDLISVCHVSVSAISSAITGQGGNEQAKRGDFLSKRREDTIKASFV